MKEFFNGCSLSDLADAYINASMCLKMSTLSNFYLIARYTSLNRLHKKTFTKNDYTFKLNNFVHPNYE